MLSMGRARHRSTSRSVDVVPISPLLHATVTLAILTLQGTGMQACRTKKSTGNHDRPDQRRLAGRMHGYRLYRLVQQMCVRWPAADVQVQFCCYGEFSTHKFHSSKYRQHGQDATMTVLLSALDSRRRIARVANLEMPTPTGQTEQRRCKAPASAVVNATALMAAACLWGAAAAASAPREARRRGAQLA